MIMINESPSAMEIAYLQVLVVDYLVDLVGARDAHRLAEGTSTFFWLILLLASEGTTDGKELS